MKAAVVLGVGQTPVYREFQEPEANGARIAVTAAAMSPVVKGRASGTHYSSGHQFPFIAGIDGVGQLEDGRRVYFAMPAAPFGSMAAVAMVRPSQCVALPDALDDVTAAAIANPGMSSWAAYTERASLVAGETVLINGATGTAGRLAVQIARYLGAKTIIATGRNVEALRDVASLGADVVIPLGDKAAMDAAFEAQFASGVDVVIDYLWGDSAERLLTAATRAGRDAVPIRFVQVGASSGADIRLPGAVLRSSAISMMGSGIGSIPLDRLLHAAGAVLQAAEPGKFAIATKAVPLAEVETAWPLDDSRRRTVFTI